MSTHQQAVEQTIQELITAGTSFDIATLDRIYHASLKVLIIDRSGNLTIADKTTFKTLFETKLAAGAPPLNTWAQFHHIETKDRHAHVLISRKVNLTGSDEKLTLSIDLINEGDGWQVTREVIFVHPMEPSARE